ncbi:O-antigen ligase family protein [Winogradskyella flava]|uniref:O-antigen ligase family protein n=1 Tax=Winogradskyella flava TaxID=1884876 RepID=UPI00249317A1|nr:O-antigen ligase family protein [Winogradskyella flava]
MFKHKIIKENQVQYIMLVLMHILLAVFIYFLPLFSKFYFISVVIFFLIRIVSASNKNKSKEVIYACCYVIGSEVLFRMTSGAFFYEAAKYLVILYMLLGIFSTGVSKKSYPYFIFLLLLIPSIFVAYMRMDYDSNLRTNIAFVLSGPVCLGISALYLYDKRITLNDLLQALKYLSLPIISMTIYLFLYNPSIKNVLKGTQSNFETSGGFGPNQVATILGVGMFILSVRLFMKSSNLSLKIVNGIILGLISFRGIVTFSRGGIMTAILMILIFLTIIYRNASRTQRSKIVYTFFVLIILGTAVWTISSSQTEGLIDKRYANQDKSGREKEDLSTGRVDLFISDLEGFINYPFLGAGANGAKELRLKNNAGLKASHNEISRLLSEHGIFAIIMLLILIVKPLLYHFNNRRNLFFYAFLCFWFATINHSAMRIAAPGFIYALALLDIKYEKRPLHRKRIV